MIIKKLNNGGIMVTVDITATFIIFDISSRILRIVYGIIRLVARRFLVALIYQYTITDNCYKAVLFLSTSKFFKVHFNI
jgi:hypothetical protein